MFDQLNDDFNVQIDKLSIEDVLEILKTRIDKKDFKYKER
jgi:hypothetical protein